MRNFAQARLNEPIVQQRVGQFMQQALARLPPCACTKQAVDDWVLYDNVGAEPVTLDWGENQ